MINASMSPRQLDEALRTAERQLAEQRKLADAQRTADEQVAGEQARFEAELLAAEDAERRKREELFAAEQEAAAAVEQTKQQVEAARLEQLRRGAEHAGRDILDRAEAELAEFGSSRDDLRDQTDAELHLQSARLMSQILGVAVPAALFNTVEPGRMATCHLFGHDWTTSFLPGEAAELFVIDRNSAPRPIRALAQLVAMVASGELPGLVATLAEAL